jgi:hypothetical protein
VFVCAPLFGQTRFELIIQIVTNPTNIIGLLICLPYKTTVDFSPLELNRDPGGLDKVTSLRSETIDLVLIDPQSVGKRTHDLMDTVNAKKRWKTIYWRVNK